MKRLVITILLATVVIGSYGQQQSRREAKAYAEAHRMEYVKKVMDSGEFEVMVTKVIASAVSRAQPSEYVSGSYFLRVKKDEIVSHLPYLGDINTQPQLARIEPLHYTSNDFKITSEDAKKSTDFKIDVISSTNNLSYYIYMQVFDNGNVSMRVGGPSLESIQFLGDIRGIAR